MALKEMLKEAIEGTGEVTESLVSAVTGVVKEGAEDISDIFGAVIDLGKDGVVDTTEGIKDVYVGAVKALKESGKSTEEALGEVTTKAEQVIGNVSQEGEEVIGQAIAKGIEEARAIIKTPSK